MPAKSRALSFWDGPFNEEEAMNQSSMNQDANKRRAAMAALAYIKDGIALGVGTGSTVDILVELLQPLASQLGPVVSSSERSTRRLAEFGIRAVDLASTGDLDLYIDGADEATKHRHLIKGGGGALTREKIVAAASRRFVCIIDETKLVPTLGRFPLPVEVIPMAQSYVARQMIKAGDNRSGVKGSSRTTVTISSTSIT